MARFHLPHSIEVGPHVHKIAALILAPEMVGEVDISKIFHPGQIHECGRVRATELHYLADVVN